MIHTDVKPNSDTSRWDIIISNFTLISNANMFYKMTITVEKGDVIDVCN